MKQIIRRAYYSLKDLPAIGELVIWLKNILLKPSMTKIEHLSATINLQNYALVGIHASLERLENTVFDLSKQLEFSRLEIFDEINRRIPPNLNGLNTPVNKPVILSFEKYRRFIDTKDIRLNLGCGHKAENDRLNVDARELPGVDIKADILNLPFDKNSVAEISSEHLLEHFPEYMLTKTILPYWYSLLKEGGTFRAVVPDAKAMISLYAAGGMDFDSLRLAIFGQQEYEGDYHFNMFTPESLSKILANAGFEDITVVAEQRRNGLCLEFEIVAKKRAAI